MKKEWRGGDEAITTDRLVQRLKDAAEKILFREGREFERRR